MYIIINTKNNEICIAIYIHMYYILLVTVEQRVSQCFDQETTSIVRAFWKNV